jgi:hypothetical protein
MKALSSGCSLSNAARQARVSSTEDTALVRITSDAFLTVLPIRSGASAIHSTFEPQEKRNMFTAQSLLLRVSIPVEAGNAAAKDGTLGSTIEGILADLKPEGPISSRTTAAGDRDPSFST